MTPTRIGRRSALALVCGALCLMQAPAAARRKQADPLPPPTSGLVDNVNGLAVGSDGHLARFTGLLIDAQGRVERHLAAGDSRPVRLAWRLDGQGRTLIPSFVHAHARVIDSGIAQMTLDLSASRSLAEAQAAISAWMRDNPGRRWILGRGWDAARWARESGTPARLPSARDLDVATGDTPAWLRSADGRLGWANSAALRLSGLKAGPAEGAFGGSERDRIERTVPVPAAKDRDIALDKAQRRLVSQGISAVADMGTTIEDWQAYRRAGDRGALRLRIVGYAAGIDQMTVIAGPEPSPWLYGDRLRLIGVLLPVPAPDDKAAMDGTRVRNQASRAAMDGFQIAFAVDNAPAENEADAAIAELSETYKGDRRWRIEMGTHTTGLPSALSAEESPFALLARIAAADGGGITRALGALTSKSAHAMFAEAQVGALEPGQWADFLIVDRDISTAGADQIAGTQILEHWIGGRRAWSTEGK